MKSLKAGLGAILPRSRKARRAYGGWVRVDADQVIRGWVTDEADPAHRPEVEVMIDGDVIARAIADRLDVKLAEAGKGDGRCAFAVIVPQAFRDGGEHGFEARVVGADYRLLSKRETFSISPRLTAPSLTVEVIGASGVRGALNGRAGPAPALEIWSGGRRLESLVPRWRPRGPEQEFEAAFPAGVLARLAADAVIAIPGMVEAGVGAASLFADINVHARPTVSGVGVRVRGVFDSTGAEATLMTGDGRILASAPLIAGEADIICEGDRRGLRAGLSISGVAIKGVDASVNFELERLGANAAFEDWNGAGPTAWSGDSIERGFHAFDAGNADAHGLSGHLARTAVPADGAPVILRQNLAELPDGEREGSLAVHLRASAPIELELRISGHDGGVLQQLPIAIERSWTWRHLEAPVEIARLHGHGPLLLELAVTRAPDIDAVVEVAGLRVGGEAEFRTAPPAAVNFINNASLLDWPNGVVVEAGPARGETAAGWFVQNRQSAGPVRAAALPIDGGAACALSLSAPQVADYCRLEIAVARDALDESALTVRFEAGAGAGVALSPFVVIERIFLLGRAGVAETVIATAGRRILVGKARQIVELSFTVPKADPGAAGDEVWLAFDFKRAFQIEIGRLVLSPAATAGAAPPHLALEDPAIAAQTAIVRGLGRWGSSGIVAPGCAFADPSATVVAGSPRWSWGGTGLGTVEVVVCVHDAVDEAVACLTSLAGSSSVPHTVSIIDDGSGEDARRRLLNFVADKPWMRLVSNPANLGYTASANLGVRASQADWVILLNSDTVVTPGWIEGMLECAASDPAIAFVGPVSNAASYQSVPELKDRAGKWKTNALPAGWTAAEMAAFVRENADKAFPRVPLLNGFCTLIRRDAFLSLGGFDEGAFPAGYGEENDLCVRAAAAGHGLAVADHVYVHHAKSASFGAARRGALQKAAGAALARLHPGIDFTELGDRMRETPALINLRAAVRRLYEEQA